MVQYVDMTPSWQQILPTWLMLYRQAIEGNCTNPDLVLANARKEFEQMASAADKWNEHCRQMNTLATDELDEQARVNEAIAPPASPHA